MLKFFPFTHPKFSVASYIIPGPSLEPHHPNAPFIFVFNEPSAFFSITKFPAESLDKTGTNTYESYAFQYGILLLLQSIYACVFLPQTATFPS